MLKIREFTHVKGNQEPLISFFSFEVVISNAVTGLRKASWSETSGFELPSFIQAREMIPQTLVLSDR